MKPPDQNWLYALLLVLAAFARPAAAHQPFESTLVARLQHQRLEIVLTMSSEMAAEFAPEAATSTAPEKLRPLEQAAADFLEVRVAGHPLALERVKVSRNREGEPQLAYVYPSPPPGELTISARYLRRLAPTYVGRLEVFDEEEKPVGQQILVTEQPTFRTALGATAAPASPPPDGRAPISPAGWGIGALALAGLAVLAVRALRARAVG